MSRETQVLRRRAYPSNPISDLDKMMVNTDSAWMVAEDEMKSLTNPEVAADVRGSTFDRISIGTMTDPEPSPLIWALRVL
jgi:hypothetical protein